MINEKKKAVYSLIISQLRYDGYTNISSQLEDYTCIQARPKNHLDKIVESFEHQWKITSFFADNECIPTLLSKNVLKDSSPKQLFNSDSRKTYSENDPFVSKWSSSNFNSFRECVTNPCILVDAQIPAHYEHFPEADLPSINSSNSELCKDDACDDISCDDNSLDHSLPNTDMNHKTDNESNCLHCQCSIDGINEFEESDDSSTSLVNGSYDSVVDLTTYCVDDAVHKSNGLENVYQSPYYLVSKSAKSESEHADKSIPSPKCSSLKMAIKSTQRCSDEDTTEGSHSYSRNDASKSFPKGTKSSFSFQNATHDEIALIFEMFEGKSMSKTAFKTIVDSIIPSIACCTVEQQLSVMLGEHVSKYFDTSENEIRFTKKYSKMTKSGLLSSILSVLGKSEIKTDFNYGLVSNTCKIDGINPGNAKSDRNLNLQHSVAQQLLAGRDKVNLNYKKSLSQAAEVPNKGTTKSNGNKVSTDSDKSKASKPAPVANNKMLDSQNNQSKPQENVAKQLLVLSNIQKFYLITLLKKKDSYTFKEFLLEARSIIPSLSVAHTAKDILIAIFSAQFSHYVQFCYDKKESHLSLKPLWKCKTSGEIFSFFCVSNSTKAERNVLVVLSNDDKSLIIDLIKKGSKTFEVFKAEADSLVASSKLTNFNGLMVSLFGDFIKKYVSLENERISLQKRFNLLPNLAILDSIIQTMKNVKRS